MVFDHGSVRTAHSGGPLADGLAAVFAGPDRTADDVIVSLVGERCGGLLSCGGDDAVAGGDEVVVAWTEDGAGAVWRNATVVVTADAGLISRCQRARRASSTLSEVATVEPASLLRELEAHASEEEEEAFFEVADSVAVSSEAEAGGLGRETADGAWVGSTVGAGVDVRDDVGVEIDGNEGGSSEVDHDADLAFVKKEDADLALRRTVELQRRLLRDMNSKIGPRRKGKASKKNGPKAKGVISARKRNKLLATRHGARKKADMDEAFKRRKVLAERLRKKLSAAPGAVTAESVPIYRLLEWLSVPSEGSGSGAAAAPPPLLTYSAGEDALSGESGPLSSVLTVPLRDGTRGVSSKDDAYSTAPPPLRIVVISDTHGFEKALLKLPSPDGSGGGAAPPGAAHPDYPVLPRADVLVHCGDFASNGSRARQRESIRKIDSFLAAQRHIPEKIVVRGNHDPETPGRVLFPKSKALYATSPKVLTVNGVRFALEPYSRRQAARGIVPRAGGAEPSVPVCDVLVSHEPPRNVLDLTYSGMRAGSAFLRRAVEKSKIKPRCWLCGHIHEGRGAAKEVFMEGGVGAAAAAAADSSGGEETTLVVNAANANYGKANRLVAGAVVVDVEREACASAAAEVTRIEEESPGVHGVGDPRTAIDHLGLELREMRPGVRRRKGLSAARRRAGRR